MKCATIIVSSFFRQSMTLTSIEFQRDGGFRGETMAPANVSHEGYEARRRTNAKS